MKHNSLLKALFTIFMCGSITLTSAADIYLSSTGVDTNDGLSPAAPVKTLSMAFTKVLKGDVIHVMSMININEEPQKAGARADVNIAGTSSYTPTGTTLIYNTWNVNGTLGIIPLTRSITIIGDDKATCGFDGNNASCIIRHDHGSGDTTVIAYKNLTFKNGKSNDQSGGGGVYFRGAGISTAVFENCDFKDNIGNQNAATLKPGGGLSIVHGKASLKNCSFSGNNASKGGALYIQAGNVTMDSCVFENNDLSATTATVGGAIYAYPTSTTAGPLNLEIKNSLFKNNKAENQGGAIFIGETVAMPSNIKFTNCAFVDNSTVNAAATGTAGMGGAVYVNNTILGALANISFINTTFKGNQAGATTGGAIVVNSLLANSTFGLINCTVSGNKVSGTTGAGGAGIRILKGAAAGVFKIQNSILENNTAVDANVANEADYADLGMEDIVDAVAGTTTPSYTAGTSLIIDKSIIGSCKNTDFATQFPTNNVNYVFAKDGDITKSFVAKLGVFNEDKNYFPLLAGSPAIGYGNVSYLKSLTPAVTTDQIGQKRPAVNCSAGAFEYEPVSGLKNTVNNSIVVYKNANNQITVKNTAESANAGTITVFNMVGQVITSAPLSGSITTINKSFNAGIYLIMVSVDGMVSTKKLILN